MNCWASALTFLSWLGEVFNNPISQPTQEEQADVIGKSNARIVYKSSSTVYNSSKHSPGTVCKAWFSSASVINIDQATVKKTSKGAKALFYIDLKIMILEKAPRWSHPILLPAPDDSTLHLPTGWCCTSINKSPGNDRPLESIGLVKSAPS